MNYPRVSIIILNWNGWKDTIECLESLYRINYPNYDVIVVDNDSKDESIEKIKEYCEGKIKQILPEFVALRSAPIEVNSKFFKYNSDNKPIKVFEINEDEARDGKFLYKEEYEKLEPNKRMILIKNKDNYGFAGGNNVGIKFALDVLNPDYVLLLNNDTVVDKDFLIEMVKVGENDEKIGIVGCNVYEYFNNSILWCGAMFINKFLWIGSIKIYEKPVFCDFVTGACMLIPTKIIKKIYSKRNYVLNESYFLYFEDIELCLFVKSIGCNIIHTPKAKIWHKISASSGWKNRNYQSMYYDWRNKIYTARKYLNWYHKIFYYPLFIISRILGSIFKYKSYYELKIFLVSLYDAFKGKMGKREIKSVDR